MNDEAMGERLVRIETKLDGLLTGRDDHELRIRKLERWMLVASGAAGAIGGSVAQLIPGLGA